MSKSSIRTTEARNALVEANMGLVQGFVKPMLGRGVSFDDLMQEGRLGLIRAAELWEEGRDIKFSTYAAYWIKQGLRRIIFYQGSKVRISDRAAMDLNRVSRLTGADGDIEAACRGLGYDDERIKCIQAARIARGHSWDILITPLASSASSVSRGVEISDSEAKARQLLAQLPKRHAETLRHAFGIGGAGPLPIDKGTRRRRKEKALGFARALFTRTLQGG